MKRVLLLVFIAIATFLIVAFLKNPDVLDDIWLWFIGLAGVIIRVGKGIFDYIKSLVNKPKEQDAFITPNLIGKQELPQQTIKLDPSKIQLTLLRFHDDTQTSLGLLYINQKILLLHS